MKERNKQRTKNARTYMVCLLVAITMWIGLKYNTYMEEQAQIKKICQIEKKAQEQQQKDTTEETKKKKPIKKITIKEEQKTSGKILPDTIKEIDTLNTTTESQ